MVAASADRALVEIGDQDRSILVAVAIGIGHERGAVIDDDALARPGRQAAIVRQGNDLEISRQGGMQAAIGPGQDRARDAGGGNGRVQRLAGQAGCGDSQGGRFGGFHSALLVWFGVS